MVRGDIADHGVVASAAMQNVHATVAINEYSAHVDIAFISSMNVKGQHRRRDEGKFEANTPHFHPWIVNLQSAKHSIRIQLNMADMTVAAFPIHVQDHWAGLRSR